MKFKLFLASLFLLASSAQANTISTTVFIDNSAGESVQYVDFNVTDAGFFNIYSSEPLISAFTDPHVLLFSNPLTNVNFITGNDDGGTGDDSLIARNLNIGSYVLAISNSILTVDEAISGYNPDVNWISDGFINVTISSRDGVATFDSPAAVPVPAAAWLFGTGLLSLAGLRKRKSA
ncbi:MAG: DVUA0089 family protein [Methylophilus sp.]|nr:DVUA0089 family protein [Methylophilus sp.]